MTQPLNFQRGGLFDLSPRTKLRVSGADRVRFLNGQITNDLQKATESSAIQASLLNAKGKLSAHVFISAEADASLIDADPELREELPARLDRYIIADDVQIEDVTDRFGIFHVTGEENPGLTSAFRAVLVDRFGCPGWDIWIEREKSEVFKETLSASFASCGEECAEVFRIERGIPRWGRELTDQIIPTEANLEAISIDYSKGCYIGQEVISRMKMSGQTNKRLCGLISLSGRPLQAGMRLESTEEGKEIGWITSAVRSHRLEKEIALGFVKRGFNSRGSRLSALPLGGSGGEMAISVEVVAIPFV